MGIKFFCRLRILECLLIRAVVVQVNASMFLQYVYAAYSKNGSTDAMESTFECTIGKISVKYMEWNDSTYMKKESVTRKYSILIYRNDC